jgi:hypothetical protein
LQAIRRHRSSGVEDPELIRIRQEDFAIAFGDLPINK